MASVVSTSALSGIIGACMPHAERCADRQPLQVVLVIDPAFVQRVPLEVDCVGLQLGI